MSLFTLDQDACRSIKTMLADKGLPPAVRIEIHSTGCCDPSLGLIAAAPEEAELTEEIDGLVLIVSRKTVDVVGHISIACADDSEEDGFVVTSERPLSEWAGFGTCSLRL